RKRAAIRTRGTSAARGGVLAGPAAGPRRRSDPFGDAETVSGRDDRVDQRVLVVAVDLLAQLADVDVDDVARRLVTHVPDLLDDRHPRQHAVRIAHQELEQRELLRRQLDLRAVARARALAEIELEPFVAQRARLARLSAAQQGADARDELLELERLREV